MTSSNENIDVSVIIVNFNTCLLTIDCIHSIFEKTKRVNFEIIVVDNASSDESVVEIRKKCPQVKLIENDRNLGFGKANNQGASHAKGTYLFLLNSDTLLINNAIEILLNFMNDNRGGKIGICGANLYTNDLKPNHSYSVKYPSLVNIFFYRSQLSSVFKKLDVFNKSEKVKDVAIIIGADLFTPRAVFEMMEGFDPFFFMYIEDGELCYRVKKAGYRIVSVPEAKIMHYQGKSSTTGSKMIMEVSSYLYYFRKHHGSFTVIVYRLIELFFAISKFLMSAIIINKQKRAAYLKLIKFLIGNG